MDLSARPWSQDASTVSSTQGSSPHHQVVVQSAWNLPKKLEFDQTFRYVSALPAKLVGAYATADVRFSWRATHSLDLSVVGQNLFQPHHAEFSGDPGGLVGIARSAYVKLTWHVWQR
jgi:iron complex outermembrane receptor protein